MANNILEYKGYHAKIEFDSNDLTLYGIIDGITDFVDFECENTADIEQEFHNAVDDYLEFCKECGKTPEKSYKGSFNVRISPDLHKELAHCAYVHNETLNATVEKALQNYIDEQKAG